MDPRIQKGSDLLETPLEDLRTVIHDRLKRAAEPVRRKALRQLQTRSAQVALFMISGM